MKRLETSIPDVILLEMDVYRDSRGFFMESYHAEKFASLGIPDVFVQDNHSQSVRGTLRGLHFQHPHSQGKLVRVTRGEVFDAAVDIRRGSPTFGRHFAAILSGENMRQMFVPAGFAHGFCVLSDVAEFQYKCTDFYHPEEEYGIAWDDADLGIEWPISSPLLSPKDEKWPRLRDTDQSKLVQWKATP